MNLWQVVKQVKNILELQKWGASSTPVFAKVAITTVSDEDVIGQGALPAAAIRILSGSSDPLGEGDEPDLISQTIDIRIYAAGGADALGEGGVIGGNRSIGQTDSGGRGILEIEEELFNAIKQLTTDDGLEIIGRMTAGVIPIFMEDMRHINFRDYALEVQCTADRFYHPVTELLATDDTGGETTLTWRNPPARFDRLALVLRRAAGSTPPASETAGDPVTVSGFPATVTDDPGVGEFSYAMFVSYDEVNSTPTTADRHSESDTVTITVT